MWSFADIVTLVCGMSLLLFLLITLSFSLNFSLFLHVIVYAIASYHLSYYLLKPISFSTLIWKSPLISHSSYSPPPMPETSPHIPTPLTPPTINSPSYWSRLQMPPHTSILSNLSACIICSFAINNAECAWD